MRKCKITFSIYQVVLLVKEILEQVTLCSLPVTLPKPKILCLFWPRQSRSSIQNWPNSSGSAEVVAEAAVDVAEEAEEVVVAEADTGAEEAEDGEHEDDGRHVI